MRQAAGILLIILGVVEVFNMIINMSGPPASLINGDSLFGSLWLFGFWPIVYGALFVTGGILCIRNKHWGLCLTSALLAFVGGIYAVVQPLLTGDSFISWETWVLVIGALISTISISLTKKEWQQVSG